MVGGGQRGKYTEIVERCRFVKQIVLRMFVTLLPHYFVTYSFNCYSLQIGTYSF